MNVLRGGKCWKLKYSKSQPGEKTVVNFCPQMFASGNRFQHLRRWSFHPVPQNLWLWGDGQNTIWRCSAPHIRHIYSASIEGGFSLIPVVWVWFLSVWFWSQRRRYQWKEPPRSKASKRIPGQKGKASLAGVVQWIECWPANQRVTCSIHSLGTCPGCGPGPRYGCSRGNHTLMFLSLSFSLLSPL